MSKVSIVECISYDYDKIKRAIDIAVGKTDFPNVENKKILLKPNVLSDSAPERCVTTHPEILRAVIRLMKERGAIEIYVGDSPAMQKKDFKPAVCGIYQVCEDEKVEWVDFTVSPVTKKLPIANHKVAVAKILDEVDMTISLSKFKTHEFMFATGSVKNMFGLMPGTKKAAQHVRHPARGSFAKLMAGIISISKTTYTIMDAVMGMEGAGPGNGDPVAVGKIIAGKDPLAVDVVQAIMMGYNPMKIPIIKFGLENSFSEISSIQDIEYPFFNANDLIMKDFKRIGRNTSANFDEDSESENMQRPAPDFSSDKCITCKKCVDICPANTLTLSDGKIVITESKCIRCYCCHEICPVNAISIQH